MKFKSFWLLVFSGLIFLRVEGQEIGSTIPEIVLRQVLHYKKGTENISAFFGKPVLLHFWASSCSGSIESLIKLDSLQKLFKGRVQIIIVSYESEKKVEGVFAENRRLKGLKFISVVMDTVLHKLFPHRTVPHIVWLDKEGVIRAVTGEEYETKKNLEFLVAGKALGFPQKKEEMDTNLFFGLVPIVSNHFEENKEKLFVYSAITGPRPDLLSFSSPARKRDDGSVQIKTYNSSFEVLYQVAYEKMSGFHPTQFIVDDSIYRGEKKAPGRDLYCYELIIRNKTEGMAHHYMRRELDRFFGYSSTLEKRRMCCLVLKRTSGIDKVKSKGGAGEYEHRGGRLSVQNLPSWAFFQNVNSGNLSPFPIYDETGLKGNIDLDFPTDFENLARINEALKKFDLQFIKDEREQEVIVISK